MAWTVITRISKCKGPNKFQNAHTLVTFTTQPWIHALRLEHRHIVAKI